MKTMSPNFFSLKVGLLDLGVFGLEHLSNLPKRIFIIVSPHSQPSYRTLSPTAIPGPTSLTPSCNALCQAESSESFMICLKQRFG